MEDKEREIVDEFRQMVLGEKDLNACTEDKFLLKFLRVWNFDCKKSLQLLRNYYKLRLDHANLYRNFSPKAPNMMATWDCRCGAIMPEVDRLGRKIIVMYLGKWDTSRCSFNDLFISLQICMEVLIEDEVEIQKNGVVMILCMNGIGLQHARQCTPSNFKKMLTLIEDSFPLWFHAFHLVNQNAIFKMIFTLLLPILSKSMRERIYLHGRDYESLYEHLSPNILPEEFGGSMEPLDHDEMVEKLFRYEEHLLKINQFGYKR